MSAHPPAQLDAIAAAVAALAADRDALAAIVRDGALSEPMARRALARTTVRYTRDALARCAAAEPAPARVASGALGGEVAVLLGTSVPTAPLRAAVLALLRGAARVTLRPPRRQPAFSACVVAALAGQGLPVELAPEPDGRAFVAHAVARGAAAVIAYGADDTLRALAASVPPGVRFEGRGHGVGASVVLAGALGDPAAAADAVAHDVADYDQFGCLSPQLVLVEHGDARPFARALAEALARVSETLPRGPLDPALAARINQWQGAVAAVAEAFHRGRDSAVAALGADARDPWLGSPGARNIVVAPAPTRDALGAALAPAAALLTCVGVAGPIAPGAVPPLPPGCAARVVPAGTMQDPPLDGYEDPRPPLVAR